MRRQPVATRLLLCAIAVQLTAFCVFTGCGLEFVDQRSVAAPTPGTCLSVVGGTETQAGSMKAVAPLLLLDGDLVTESYCSATWVGPQVMLTARHCVSGRGATSIAVAFAEKIELKPIVGKSIAESDLTFSRAVEVIILTPSNSDASRSAAANDIGPDNVSEDVALIRFKMTPPHATLSISTQTLKMNQSVTLAGFGSNEIKATSQTLIRREGKNVVAAVNRMGGNNYWLANSTTNSNSSSEALSAAGDSGGPLIEGGKVVGVISAGSTASRVVEAFQGAAAVSLIAPMAAPRMMELLHLARARGISLSSDLKAEARASGCQP